MRRLLESWSLRGGERDGSAVAIVVAVLNNDNLLVTLY
jgi:hypothetical protein